jgi:hypothetical protein
MHMKCILAGSLLFNFTPSLCLFPGNLTSLVVPAATLGALGYGYMWWKVSRCAHKLFRLVYV